MFARYTLKLTLNREYDSNDSWTYKIINPKLIIKFIYDYCIQNNINVIYVHQGYSDEIEFKFKNCNRKNINLLVYNLNERFGGEIRIAKY